MWSQPRSFGLYWKIIVCYQLTLVVRSLSSRQRLPLVDATMHSPTLNGRIRAYTSIHGQACARRYTGRTKGTSLAIVYTIISTRGTGQIRGVTCGINNVRCIANNVHDVPSAASTHSSFPIRRCFRRKWSRRALLLLRNRKYVTDKTKFPKSPDSH